MLTKYVTFHIVNPIDNLVQILDRMMEGDLDINIEEHYELCSKEITKLYTVFTKLKIVLRFGKSKYFTEDSEAIMNYAQALALFLEFRNMEGVGVCYNNLGIIHYKNHRFHEAIECFAKALEAAQTLTNQHDLIVKRKHMLATTMMAWKKNEKRAPALMKELIDIYKAKKDLSQAVECLLLVAENCIRINEDYESYLNEAEEILKLKNRFSTPKEILETKLLYCKGLSLVKKGFLREGCATFINCLTEYSIYDPETRKKCLDELLLIYQDYNISIEFIDSILQEFQDQERDIIFLLDYSMSMTGSRIAKSQQNFIKVINTYVAAKDRIAYIVFNKICNVVFNLTQKGNDCSNLLFEISKWDNPKGPTAFYDAISLALQEFHGYKIPDENSIPFDCRNLTPKKRAQ